MLEIPFAIQWTIPEAVLTALKDSIKNEILCSSSISNIPGFQYYLKISPNGDREELRGKTLVFFHLKFEKVMKVDAKWNVSIESANYSFSLDYIFEESTGRGRSVCDTKDFFDPEKKFIVDGECTIKVDGIFKFESENPLIPDIGEKQKWDGGELGDEMWTKDDTKDFTIVVDEKDIKVHKLILDSRSNVFSAMLNSKKKESTENKVEISYFPFDVVETAIKLIYNCNFVSSLTFDDQMSLLQFFDKYNLPTLKDKVEQLLIYQISASNVCRLTNCSVLTNSTKLKIQCMKFLTESFFQTYTPLADIEILDKDIALKILRNSLYENVQLK